jgi:hypothetical protein
LYIATSADPRSLPLLFSTSVASSASDGHSALSPSAIGFLFHQLGEWKVICSRNSSTRRAMYTGPEGTRSLGLPSCHQCGFEGRENDSIRATQHLRGEDVISSGFPSPSHVKSGGDKSHHRVPSKRPSRSSIVRSVVAIALLASTAPIAEAQNCVSLSGSTTCPAFNQSSVSTDSSLTSQL